jgi:hypothetical protein
MSRATAQHVIVAQTAAAAVMRGVGCWAHETRAQHEGLGYAPRQAGLSRPAVDLLLARWVRYATAAVQADDALVDAQAVSAAGWLVLAHQHVCAAH